MLWWLIATDGWLVHVPPSGTWAFRKSGDLVAADAWLRTTRRPAVDAAVRLVVAILDDNTATLKRFYKERDRIRLQPANSEMEPIYARDVKIQGKVIGVIRRLS